MSALQVDSESGVHVSVVPSQSSYFAGEPFAVQVTFTNTRTPNQPPTTRRNASHTHKRAAHSVSSAPLARPPTSPVTPKTALPILAAHQDGRAGLPTRRGVIGLGQKRADDPSYAERRMKKLTARSLSVAIGPLELDAVLTPGVPRTAPAHTTLNDSESSAITRNTALPPNHPHARKQSVLDGSVQLHDISSPPSPSPFPPSAAASTSAFSLTLDPISEGSPTGFSATSSAASPSPDHAYPLASLVSHSHSYPPKPGRRPAYAAHVALGNGGPPGMPPPTSRTAYSSTFPPPNTELILYSYAQLVGTLVLSPQPAAPTHAPTHTHTLNAVRGALLKRQAVGGGSMDISSSMHSRPHPGVRRTSSHSRSSSFSASIMSLLSPSPSASSSLGGPPAQPSWSPGHKLRSPSLLSAFLSPSTSSAGPAQHAGLGLGIGSGSGSGSGVDEPVDPETPLPTFEVQPAMLAVDLSLRPGESRTYTYKLTLPDNLPPTFKGRALKFSYQFVVGICRANPTPSPPTPSPPPTTSPPTPSSGNGSISRVMKVPIRIYNNVVVSGVQRPYDLLWPVSRPRPEVVAKVSEQTLRVGKRVCAPSMGPAVSLGSDSLDSLREYADRLMSSFPDPLSTGVRIKLPIEMVASSKDWERDREAGELTGCREAVEILTRNPKKVSYDVNKDGVKVAVLTFVKSAYRLGETVLGVVELNERWNRARVLKLSAMLEAHESLPNALSPPSLSKHLRKVHAEHHSSLMPATLRTTFALDIPSDASPAFQCAVSGNKDQDQTASGGLEWKVRLCLLVATASDVAREGFDGIKVKHMVRDGPRSEWGSAWKATGGIAPLERPDPRKAAAARAAAGALKTGGPAKPPATTPQGPRGWASYFISNLLMPGGEREYHDGDEDYDDEEGGGVGAAGGGLDEYGDGLMDEYGDVDFGGGVRGWDELRAETVECEVPIRVWPGNTAFKPLEVVFDI